MHAHTRTCTHTHTHTLSLNVKSKSKSGGAERQSEPDIPRMVVSGAWYKGCSSEQGPHQAGQGPSCNSPAHVRVEQLFTFTERRGWVTH